MATEALYVEMWAQDAAAMYGYAGASAVAAQVTPFAAPPQTAADDGTSNQASAVAQAAAAPAGQAATVAQNAVAAAPTTTTQTTTATTALPAATTSGTGATGGATVPPTTFFPWLEQLIYNTYSNYPSGGWLGLGLTNANITTVLKQTFQAYFAVGMGQFGASIGQQTTFGLGTTAGSGGAWYPTPQFAGLALGNGGMPVSAGIGQASTLGRLSVPPGWPGATPAAMEEAQLASTFRPIATPTSNAMLNGMPMANAAGGRRGAGYVVKYGFRHAVMPRPPIGG